MHLGKIFSVQTDLASSHVIEIEVDVHKSGLPAFSIVGLPDKAVEESRERVCAAIKNSGFDNPKKHKIVTSLSPADVKKEGPQFDLPIALGVLLASDDDVDFDLPHSCFIGELALDGAVRSVKGVLGLTQHAQASGYTSIYVPQANASEAALIRDITVYPVSNLKQLIGHLNQIGSDHVEPSLVIDPAPQTTYQSRDHKVAIDFKDIVDQHHAKRTLLIAAAGGHNIGMYGPAGTGKTMLAKALAGILPPLSYEQMLESTAIHSYVGLLDTEPYLLAPPYRSPHHTSSYVSIIGGGTHPRPGEISLAHNGVLFMDEFPEFDKRVLESLREPLEDREVRISRARGSVTFPAHVMLVAAMNPPSAVYRDPTSITPAAIRAFNRKLSGPIMDRIDVWTEVPKIEHDKLLQSDDHGPNSQELRSLVIAARTKQTDRLGSGRTNASMNVREIKQHIPIDAPTKQILDQAAQQMNLSPRVYHKIVKISRTIADLDNTAEVCQSHVLEALSYRPREII